MISALFSNINWLAVLLGAVGYFLLGAVWYSFLFQKSWIKHAGVNMNDPNGKKGMAQIMMTSFVLMFICSIGLAILAEKLMLSGWMNGVKLGALTGICFSATAISISYIYEKRSAELHLINGAYNIVGSIIAAVIICCWH
ncbi:MAG: DUF1761 domain-containing protein [Chitinophagaceae bacterium]|nr:DUF1761 domain-containing protein [Chitinophagaceae bacterium]